MKRCAKCGEVKRLVEFRRDRHKASGYGSRCKPCGRADAATRRAGDPAGVKAISDRSRVVFKAWLYEQKSGPCTDCALEWPPYVMQFDHLPGFQKAFEVNTNARSRTREAVVTEIAKCELVCANCHAIRTHERRQG